MTIESQFANFVYIATAISIIFVLVGAIASFRESFKESFNIRAEREASDNKPSKLSKKKYFSL
jgi:hypothetical protein